MAEYMPDVTDMDEQFEHDGHLYLFEPEYTDKELCEIEDRARQKEEQQAGEAAAARLRSADIWWCWCWCCEEESLCCNEWGLYMYNTGGDVYRHDTTESSPHHVTASEDFPSLINRIVNRRRRPRPQGPNGLLSVEEEIFDNPDAGASPNAAKVLMLITDGDPIDVDTGIIKRYDDKNIIRFVIGVKNVMLEKFMVFASEPKDENVFKIENYNGLTGLLDKFRTKISKVEGDVTTKMSQREFSAVFSKENLILSPVGSNSWRSPLQDCHEDPHIQKGSHRGYSTSVGRNNNTILYFTGAPRFEHTGQVVLFRHDDKNWTAAQTMNGEQIGSYFGAELCSVDVNSDGNTDFLLVGAPLFYQPQGRREGRIYIYKLTDEMRLERGLDVSASSMGRFGTTISSVADLNGDGLRDVAVGAPLEDDDRGAVYIFLGDKHSGIRSTFSQRILGQQIKPELRFFGLVIDGDINLGEDVPPNIVVGSQGMAVVLRSRPVFNVTAHLSAQPEEISTDNMNCPGNMDESLPVITLRGCFEMIETTKCRAGTTNSGLQISYVLDVDPLRETNRGFFSQTDKKARNVTSTHELRDKHTCFSYFIYMPTCVDDTVSPLSIRLKFFQVDSESASAVLDVDSETQAVVEVPFQK